MFGLGAWEIALILGVALVFLGPEKLPEVAKTLGKTLRQIRTTANDFTRELNVESYLRDEPKRSTKPPQDTDRAPEEDPYHHIAAEESASEHEPDPAEDEASDAAEATEAEVVETPGHPELPEIKPAKDSIARSPQPIDLKKRLPSESERE